jgi:hypothetical protein
MGTDLSDAQWELIQPLLPAAKPTGRPRADDRRTLNSILYVLRTGCRWKDLPDRYGSSVTCWRRLDQLKRGQQIGLTRRGKGSKLMLVVESHGLPIGGLVTSAQKAEVKLAEPTLLIR